ncbi:MAG: MBL fold metallo-hydrolase [Armatimonadota bacterium]|nr:MBL fold metallo-hydrolase [Armatimonadota bacterium]
MKIKWLGHSSFLITAENGTKILTDPYEPGGFGGSIRYGPITEHVQIVTSSHEHADHGHLKDLSGEPVILRNAGSFVAEGITFEGVHTFHDAKQGAERGSNVVFAFVVDGVKVCHLGDLGHVLSGDQAARIGAVDVLLTPVGGFFTIGSDEAWKVAEQLAAKIVIPMHFKTPKIEFPIAGVDDFLADKPNVKKFHESQIEVKNTELPAERQIVVLQPAL